MYNRSLKYLLENIQKKYGVKPQPNANHNCLVKTNPLCHTLYIHRSVFKSLGKIRRPLHLIAPIHIF